MCKWTAGTWYGRPKDINKVIKLNPAIDVTGSVKDLMEELIEAEEDYVRPDDALKKSTRELLTKLAGGSAEGDSQEPEPEPET